MEKVIGIPVNLPSHRQFTGVERYVIELLRSMMKMTLPAGVRVELYSSEPITLFGELPQGWSNVVLPWKYKGWTLFRLSWHMWRHAPDILFIPIHEVPFVTGRAKVVSTIHDIAFAVVPQVYPRKAVRRQWAALRRALRKSDHVLSVSESTKQDLMRIVGVDQSKISTTSLAPSTSLRPGNNPESIRRTLQKYRVPYNQYLLFVGRLEYKKGIPELLRIFDAYKKAQGIGDPLQLVLVGKYGFGESIIKDILKELGRDDIKVLGFVEDEELVDLFDGARAFVFPTRYEGFGIPLLEAMYFDLPILTTDLPVAREVVGPAALFAPPGDTAAWLRIIRQVTHREDVVQMLVEAGRVQRAKFSWEKTAQETWRALQYVLGV